MIRLIEGSDHRRWRFFLALLLITLSALLLSTHVVKCEADAGQPSQEVEAGGTPSLENPSNHLYHQQQTSVLDRCWWRNLEEQDAFIRTLFRKPLASANIGVVSSVMGGDTDGDNSNGNDDEDGVSHGGKKYGIKHRTAKQSRQAQQRYATRGRAVAHHAPANVTDQKKRFFIPRLHFVYTMTEEESQHLAAQSAATEVTPDTQPTAADGGAASGAASYTQRLRSVLPLGFGGVTDSVERPLTPLQVAARRSPIAHLRAFVRDGGSDDDREKDGVRSGIVTAAEAETETEDDAEKTAATTTTTSDAEKNSGEATNMAEEEVDASLTRERSTAATPGTPASTQDPRSSYVSQSEAEEKLVVVSSDTKALIPLTITGSSYTIVQFNGKAGNTINAVVQLKDHRFNKYVRVNNCHSMYITVELRNHVKTQSDTTTTTAAAAEAGDAAKWRTLPTYAQAYRSLWGSASADSSADHDAGSGSSSDGPDVTSNGRGGFASFWNSFALMFDTSALCKVMASLPLRIDKAPRTEPFYVVMRSTISYAYDRAYYYNTSSGTFYTNPRDDDYTCELDLYMEQWPAAQQERKQFLFAFVLPLLVLLLPLPFTMRRADLVQQYMMETDYAQWVWRPPYYLRDKLIDGLKAMMNWVVNLRTSLQQRRLMAQLQQQQQRQGEAVVPSDTNIADVTSRTTFMNAPGAMEPGMTAAAAATTYTSTMTPSEAPTTISTAQHATAAVEGAGQTNNESSPHVPQLAARDLHAPSPYHTTAAAASLRPKDGGDEEGHHGVCTPRQQQQQLAPSGVLVSSPCGSDSSYEHSLTGSMNGSDCDDGHDCHCGCSHHGDHPQHRYQNTHPGAVSPPQSSACAPDTLLCAGPAGSSAPLAASASVADVGAAAAAHQDDSVEEEGQEDGASRRHSCTSKRGSKTTSSSSNTNNRRCHHHCRHHDDDGSEHHAVSVHVPLLLESPVVNNARPTGRHASAHDLLFNASEAAAAAAGGQQQEFIKTHTGLSREEKADAEERHADGVVMSNKATGWDSRNKLPTDDKSAEGNGSASATTTATAAAAGAAEEEDEEPFCRICREGSDVAPLITPCGCTGSVRFVHSSCLDRWRIESAKRNLSNVNHCEICKMPFTVNIRRSALIWESSQHLLRGISLFLTCFTVIVLTTTLTHGILGELSCLASYHEVAYSTMFRFEGLSLSLFVYGLAVLLVLFANLIVYSWFRSRREVEEYVADLHVVPPFYTPRNMALIVLVSLLLLAQVHAMGFLLKYFLYNTSNLVWSWETSPLVGGMLFALFMTCSITVCSWGRQMYMTHVAPRLTSMATAEDVVVVDGNTSNNNGNGNHRGDENASTARGPGAAAAEAFDIPTSTTLNYMGPPPSRSQQQQQQHLVRGSELAAAGSPSQPPPHPLAPSLSSAGAAGTRAQPEGVPAEEDVTYTRHFEVPPEHRVIRAFEYCPPTRKVPK